MSEETPVRKTRFPLWFWAAMAGLFLVLVATIWWFLGSPAFEQIVRGRVVAVIEKSTGGKVELQSLRWNVSKLEIEAKGLTLHGLEPAGDVPLAHVDRLYVRLRVVSFVNTNIDLSQLTLDRPEVHFIVNPDGTTNVPEPQVKSNSDPIQQLFDLAVGKVELNDGSLLINEERLPLDLKAYDLAVAMSYRKAPQQYDGMVHVGKIDGQFKDFRVIPASADAEFALWRNRARIRSFKLTSQRSAVELSGTVDDFKHPHLQLTYGGTMDLAQVGEIIRVYKLREGDLTFSGSGSFGPENFSTSGKFDVRGVSYEGEGLALSRVNASADYSVDRDQFLLRKINARAWGGTMTGEAAVKNYSPPLAVATAQIKSGTSVEGSKPVAPAAARTQAPASHATAGALPVQQGSANLKVNGVSLSEVVRVLSSKSLPLEKLNAAGVVNGTVNLAWKDSAARSTVDVKLDAAVPAQSASNQLPVSGALRGHYDVHSGTLELAQFNLATPRSEANASGVLGSRDAQLKIAVTTTSLAEFEPLLRAMGESPLPVELDGRASFNGTLSGKIDRPDIAGHLLATDFTYLYRTPVKAAAVAPPSGLSKVKSLLHLATKEPAPEPQPVASRIHIDSLAGDLQYGRTEIALRNGVIAQGSARLNVDGSAALQDGSFSDNTPFDVRASVHNGNVADLLHTLGKDYPVAGVVNFSLQASGTQADPHGRGQFAITDGEAFGHPIQSLTSDIVLANHEAEFENIHMEAFGGSMAGSVAYNLNNRQIRSDLHGDKLDLEKVAEVQSPLVRVRGTANFRVKTSGTLNEPMADVHAEVANLVLNDEVEGGLVLDAVSHGSKLQIAARSKFPRALLALDGTVDLEGDMESDLRLQFTQIDIDPLLSAALRTQITGHSALGGHATLSGPLRRPRWLKGTLLADAFTVELAKIPIHSVGPIELSLADSKVMLDRMTVAAEDTNLSIGGSIDFKGERRLDLYAKGHLNVALIHVLDKEITAYGTTDADVTVRGTMAKPVMEGRVVIAHAGFSVIDMPAGLGELNGTMVFNQDRLEVERLSGRVGGGQVNFSGYMTFGSTIGFDLTTTGSDVRFRYGGVSVTADQDLRLAGTLRSSTLSGVVTITRFAQIPVVDAAAAFIVQPVEVPNPASPLNNLRLDVRIVSAPELTVQTSLAKLSGDADLRLRGTAMRPVLLGRINIAEGDIKLNGSKYHLDRGDITFANPVHIDPILDMEATTRVRDFDITIGLHGTMEKLTTTYRSDPPLSSDDIIALLAFGRTQEESASTVRTGSLGEGAGGLVLGEAINQAVSNRVSKLFGVSSIRINPSIGGADNNPSARLTVEQQVSKDVTLTYITNLTQSAQQVIQFEYNINTEFTLLGIRDENGVVSFDVLIRKRKK
jgi:translocation and assembly module TamB